MVSPPPTRTNFLRVEKWSVYCWVPSPVPSTQRSLTYLLRPGLFALPRRGQTWLWNNTELPVQTKYRPFVVNLKLEGWAVSRLGPILELVVDPDSADPAHTSFRLLSVGCRQNLAVLCSFCAFWACSPDGRIRLALCKEGFASLCLEVVTKNNSAPCSSG